MASLALHNFDIITFYLFAVAGISPGKLVEAHGSFSTASCIKCKSKQDSEEVKVRFRHTVWTIQLMFIPRELSTTMSCLFIYKVHIHVHIPVLSMILQ